MPGPDLILEQVISGGQTGVDQVGLRVAEELGYRTGGTAPLGFRTEGGTAPWLGTRYGLVESSSPSYHNRTIDNIRAADLTVWFGDVRSGGGRLTQRVASSLNRWLENPTSGELRQALIDRQVRILNVAGNRLSLNPQAAVRALTILVFALRKP